MGYFRVELDTVSLGSFNMKGRYLNGIGAGNDLEIVGNAVDGVGVRHPYLRAGQYQLKQWIMLADVLQVGAAIFTCAGGAYLAAVEMGDILGAITNAQYRQLAMKFFKIEPRRISLAYRIWAARKDNAFHTAVNFGKM